MIGRIMELHTFSGLAGLLRFYAGRRPASLRCRIAPDPVAFLLLRATARREESEFATIIRLVPANRVEQELAVLGALVAEWLAADDIVGNLFQKARRQGGVRARLSACVFRTVSAQ